MYALDYTQENYDELMEVLLKEFNRDLLNYSRGSIKAAMIDFFSTTLQKVDIRFSGNRIKMLKEFDEKNIKEPYDRLIHQVKLKLLDMSYEMDHFRRSEFLYEIPDQKRDLLMGVFDVINETELKRRNVIRRQMYQIFSLKVKDVILFLRGKIYIRAFIPKKPPENDKDRRLGGMDPELIAQCYANHFPEGVWNEIQALLPDVLYDKLNFSRISNRTFGKTFVPVLLSLIDIIVDKGVDDPECREVSEGLSAYILRQHFDDIMFFISENLVSFVLDRDMNAEQFVKYYEDEIVMDSGQKLKKSPILDEDGQKWNFSSILSVLMQYKQAMLKLKKYEEEVNTKKERVARTRDELDRENQKLRELEEAKNKIEEVIRELNSEKQLIKYKENKASKEEKKDLNSQVARLNTKIDKEYEVLKTEQAKCSQQETKIQNKQKEFDNWQKHLDREQDNHSNFMESQGDVFKTYEKIVKAIAKTIAKR